MSNKFKGIGLLFLWFVFVTLPHIEPGMQIIVDIVNAGLAGWFVGGKAAEITFKDA